MSNETPIAMLTPLFNFVETDDIALNDNPNASWFHTLRNLDWKPFRVVAAMYYQALAQRNVDATLERTRKASTLTNTETLSEAKTRLLFERPTMDGENTNILFEHTTSMAEKTYRASDVYTIDPETLEPGKTPIRLAGRAPKCFFAMLKAFISLSIMGRASEPETVHQELFDNPSFARTCGFTYPRHSEPYRQSDIPSLRKLEQFDQILTQEGLWGQLKWEQVKRNIGNKVIKPEETLAHDTTHYQAFSSMTVQKYEDEVGNEKKKSHPKTTKNCRCKDRENCHHPWVSADEGAGTVVKAHGKMHWAHKASTICFPGQGVLLDAVAMTDSASHDSKSVEPHLKRLFEHLPQIKDICKCVLDDGAADDSELKERVRIEFGVDLHTSQNPRSRKSITQNLPRGLERITPTGTPMCSEGYPFDLLGKRNETEVFIFAAPKEDDEKTVCEDCPKKTECCPRAQNGRRVTIPWHRLPWIDPSFPQLSIRYQLLMAKRTAIERMHKLMKYDFGEPRLRKRGNDSFQALLDKTVFAMQVLLAQ